MAIWGHEKVHVLKDVENRRWVVSTPMSPRQELVTIPWRDAFKVFKHAPDYSEAIATCQYNERTALTEEEERSVQLEIDALAVTEALKTIVPPPPETLNASSSREPAPVISLDAFRKKKR